MDIQIRKINLIQKLINIESENLITIIDFEQNVIFIIENKTKKN